MTKGGLFGKKKHPEAVPPAESMSQELSNLSSRLRMLESRYTDLDRKFELIESNLLGVKKRINKEIKVFDSDTAELRKEIDSLRDKIEIIISSLERTASKEDIDTIKKYLELWNPVKFATREEVEEIVDEKLEK
ncbi:hypothetical protein GF336_04885 [Candidatus Woesearchaeota archaeon]|nr:hypothetical protein [Candidatus Woesearchaeota archaeon]